MRRRTIGLVITLGVLYFRVGIRGKFSARGQLRDSRGDHTTTAIPKRLHLAPGYYTGLLTQTSEVKRSNFLTLTPEGQARMYLRRLSSLVVRSQPLPL